MESIERGTYSAQEVALRLGVSAACIYKAVAQGDLPSLRLRGRILIPREPLERLLRESGHDGGDRHAA